MVAVASAVVVVAIEGDMDITPHFRIRHGFLVDPPTEGVAFKDSTGVLSGGTTEFTALFDIIWTFFFKVSFLSQLLYCMWHIYTCQISVLPTNN